MSLLAAQTLRRGNAILKGDVKKDDLGFEDISDFWDAAANDSGLEYDTSGSITEDEYEDSDNEDLRRRNSSVASSKGRKSSLSSTLPLQDNEDDEDDAIIDSASVFQSSAKKSMAVTNSPYDASDDIPTDEYYADEPNSRRSSSRRVSFGKDVPSPVIQRTPKVVPKRNQRSALTPMTATPSSAITTPGSRDFQVGFRVQDESYAEEPSTDDDLDETNTSAFTSESSFLRSAEKSRSFAATDDDEERSSDDEGVRRSRRRTKGQRFQFWKNERPVYNKGEIIGFMTANPTPAKPKRPLNRVNNRSSNQDEGVTDDESARKKSKTVVFNKKLLPKQNTYINRKELNELAVWDDPNDSSTKAKIVSFVETLKPAELPITEERPANKLRVGYAAQSFNVPELPNMMSGWISGYVDLPPEAIKDAEGVGECAQVFIVAECHDGAVEVGIAEPSSETWNDATAQRVLLKRGDSFYVPPGNIYRLENHSSDLSCKIYWTIIKPLESAN